MIHVRRLVRGVADLLTILALVGGVPALLAATVGVPSLTLPTREVVQEDPGAVLSLLAIIIWPTWALVAASVALEGHARVTDRRRATSLRLAGPLQPFIRRRIAGVAMLLAGSWQAPRVVVPPVLGALVQTARPAVALAEEPRPGFGPQLIESHGAVPAEGTKWIISRPGDNLWDLAERHLGDPERFPELIEMNKGLPQPDRCCLEPPGDFIRPGWLLLMPSDAGGTAIGPIPEDFARLRGADPELPPPPPPGEVTSPTPPPALPTTVPVASADPDVEVDEATGVENDADDGADGRVVLPGGSVVGASFASGVATAVIAGRLRRRRRWRPDDLSAPVVLDGEPRPTVARLMAAAVKDEAVRRRQPGDATVAIGHRDGEEVSVDLVHARGMAFTGPGREHVARAVAVAMTLDPDGFAVVSDEVTVRRLIGAVTPPNVQVFDRSTEVLARAETELATRARLMDRRGATDFAEYVEHNPDAPLPVLVVLLNEVEDAPRLAAIVESGCQRGIGAVVLAEWPGASWSCFVHEDLSLDVARHRLPVAGYGLDATRSREVVAALVDSAADAEAAASRPGVVLEVPTDKDPNDTAIEVTALGGLAIRIAGTDVRLPRAKSREALAYFLLRPKGAPAEAVMDALWPDVDPEVARPRFWKALSDLRGALRSASGIPDLEAIEPTGGELYCLSSANFDADLWRFERALGEARGEDRVDALERAVAAYAGDLFDGLYYEWAQLPATHLRGRALTAVTQLAELYEEAERLDDAAAVLERGIALDPLAEELYARLIALHCRQGRTDSARRVFRRLEAQLAEIGEDPLEETSAPLAALRAPNPG